MVPLTTVTLAGEMALRDRRHSTPQGLAQIVSSGSLSALGATCWFLEEYKRLLGPQGTNYTNICGPNDTQILFSFILNPSTSSLSALSLLYF